MRSIRIEQLTFTRFIAAIFIVIFHFGKNLYPFNSEFLVRFISRANVGVSYFFILSGFVMMIAYFKGNETHINPLQYYKNRIARIYPVYFLALMLFLFYILFFGEKINYPSVALNLLGIQSWIPPYPLALNPPGWSLSVEFFFYLIFPFLVNKIYRNRTLFFNTMLIVSIWILSQILLNFLLRTGFYHGFPSKSHDLIYYFPAMHLNEFLMGNLLGLFFLKFPQKEKRNYDLYIIFLSLLFIIVIKYGIFKVNFHNGFLAILFLPIIFLLSRNSGLISKIFNWAPLILLGEISYGIYILQKPVFQHSGVIMSIMGITNLYLRFYVSLSILIISSYLIYRFFEVPLRKFISDINLNFFKTFKGNPPGISK